MRIRGFLVGLFALGPLYSSTPTHAQGTLAPVAQIQWETNAGAPCASCNLYTYEAGTTTQLNTYSDETLATLNAWPIALNSSGRNPAGGIFLQAAAYKFELRTSGGTVLWTQDSVRAVPTTNVSLDVTGTAGEALAARDVVYMSDASGSCGASAGRWYKADADLTCASTIAKYVGMVQSACASGLTTCSIRIQGRITGLSGLTAGTEYYASATAAALTSTAPANARLIGAADSTTAILIAPNPGSTLATLTVTGNTTLGDAVADTVTVVGMLANTSLRVADTNATHALVWTPGTNLTADRIFTLTTGDAARTLTMTGDATVNQDVSTTASPTFVGATFSGALATPTTITQSGHHVFSTDSVIRRNTSDGSDNGSLSLTGGGATGTARSGEVFVYGNENGVPGTILAAIGNVASSKFAINRADGTESFNLLGSDGSATFTSSRSDATGSLWDFRASHASTPEGITVTFTAVAPNGTGSLFFRGIDTLATRFQVRSNGGIANYSANDVNLSDATTKDIFGPAPSQRELFRRLQFVEARYKDAPATTPDVMLTAQQVQTVYPDLVTEFADGKLGVREHGIMMRAFQVVQEHDEQLQKQLDLIAGLVERVRLLEAEVMLIKARLPQPCAPGDCFLFDPQLTVH